MTQNMFYFYDIPQIIERCILPLLDGMSSKDKLEHLVGSVFHVFSSLLIFVCLLY